MNNYTVFLGLNPSDDDYLTDVTSGEIRYFERGEIITKNEQDTEKTAILLDGLAYMICANESGRENILEYYERGNVIGPVNSMYTYTDIYYILAKKKCKTLFFDNHNILSEYSSEKKIYTIFINNLINSPLNKALFHIDLLSQGSTRKKLLFYFRSLMTNHNNTIICPMPLSDLADYLCVDRSSMMREIKKLNDDNIIRSKGQSITILNFLT